MIRAAQYKNKPNFYQLSQMKERYGVACEWHFFETGHGKGPCDGAGGTLKRGAARAALIGKTITNASQLYDWAVSALHSIRPIYISKDEITARRSALQKEGDAVKLKTMPCTQKMHHVVPRQPGIILAAPLSSLPETDYKVHSLTQVGYKDDGDQVDESDCETENDEIDDPDGDEIGDEIDKDEMVDPDGNGESDEEKQTGPIKLSDFVIIKVPSKRGVERRWLGEITSVEEEQELPYKVQYLKKMDDGGKLFSYKDGDSSHKAASQVVCIVQGTQTILDGRRIMVRFKHPVNVLQYA